MALLRGHWQLLLLTGLVFAFWQTPFAVPLKILIVFFHEASHAIATVLTGGDVVSLSISADQGGLVLSRGGSRFIILSAGYLGSLLIGVALLVAATRSKADRVIMAGCGIVLLVLAGLYIREGFALTFVICTGVCMLLVARFLGHNANDLILRIIGLTSVIYVPYDIFSDTVARPQAQSDARMLADEFGGSAPMWGILWIVLGLIVIFWCLRSGLGRSSNLRLR